MSNLIGNQKPSSCFIRKATSNTIGSLKTEINEDKSQNKVTSILNIPGTRTSLQNNQLLTSIGIPSIDSFIGGGLPVGSVCLIGQDESNTYTDVIRRCFIAEGVFHKHSIYVADLNESLNNLIHKIPSVNKTENEIDKKKSPSNNEELRIAWRYSQNQQNNTEETNKAFQANYFVMNKFMSDEEVKELSDVKLFNPTQEEFETFSNYENSNPLYKKLANEINSHIDSLNMNINKTKKYKNILRIVINSIGDLSWNDKSTLNENDSISLCKFLYYMRTLLRHSLSVCMITVPNEIVKNFYLMDQYSHLSDYVFIMDDSTKSTSRLTKTQYDGLFRLSKLPSLNSLNQSFLPETLDLAFYIKRKRLVVEQLHLPPDLGENDDTQKGRTSTSTTMSCSSSSKQTGSNKLDF